MRIALLCVSACDESPKGMPVAPASLSLEPASTPAMQRAVAPQTEGQYGVCDFDAWSNDNDPGGTNVRAGPSLAAAIVGKLPPKRERGEILVGAARFKVVEARDGWFRIADAGLFVDPDTPEQPLPSGWIDGSYVDFELHTDRAFAAPDPTSTIVVTNWQTKAHERRDFAFEHPVACKGAWVRLTVTGYDRKPRSAWARGICGNLEVPCDGLPSDSYGGDNDLPVH